MSDNPKTPERPTCGTCPYWEGCGNELDDPDASPEGVCHRFPAVFIGPGPKLDGDCSQCCPETWSQPWTYDRYWCGEHPDFPAYLAALAQRGGPESR